MVPPVLILAAVLAGGAAEPATWRLDYFHTGTASEKRFALDEVVLEGAWPGRLDRAVDDTNLGKYLFEVVDLATNRVVYSRGFASIYGEWETTPEARERHRTFHESLRFPEPEAPVQVVLKKRGPCNGFSEVWSVIVDPADPTIDRTGPPPTAAVWAVQSSGEPRDKVDLLLLGDGYTEAEMDKWHADARRLTEELFSTSPFKERRRDFNVWAVDTPCQRSGVSRPSDGVYRRSALRAAYDAFGSERPEPWEPNVTADPGGSKWSQLTSPDTPLPTPWPKERFEEAQREIQARRRAIRSSGRPETEMEALFGEERGRMTRLLGSVPHASHVGAFEGAMYQARGYFRSQADCIMFTRDEVGFCAVCRRAIERVIDMYARH